MKKKIQEWIGEVVGTVAAYSILTYIEARQWLIDKFGSK